MTRRIVQLVLVALAVLAVVGSPASGRARMVSGPCASPSFIGQVEDNDIWFRYPQGRDAQHITAGTYDIEIRDVSTTQNFHLSDYTWHRWSYSTSGPGTGVECWRVTFEATQQQNGDYEFKSDFDTSGNLRGLITAHPGVPAPPPPPPPPSPAGPPPPPPPPPQQPDLIATVGPEQRIAMFFADGRRVSQLPPGEYTLQVHDLSTAHNFHLIGPGVNESTPVGEIVHPIWRLTFKNGVYTFKCDVHAAMKGTFKVAVGAPPPPTKCRVPRVIGKTLAAARRAIAAAHCSVGRVARARSKRTRGRVVSQTPRAGRTQARGAPVNVVVSRGAS